MTRQPVFFNCCLLKVKQNRQTQLKAITTESKGRSASRESAATDELQYLLDFNSSVCHGMAKSMEYLTVFVNMANTTLYRRDSYLSYLKPRIKADTLNALRTAPYSVIKQTEEGKAAYDKGHSGCMYKNSRYHPYERLERKSDSKQQDRPVWKNISPHGQHRKGKGKQ